MKRLLRIFPTCAQWKSLKWPLFWAVLSGIILRFAFPPFELGWIAWFGMAPFLTQFYNKTPNEGAWIAFIFGLVYFYLNLMWLNYLVNFFWFMPAGIVLAAIICSIYLLPFGALTAWALSKRSFARFLFVPTLWVAVEFVRGQSEIGFPWMYLGHTQVGYLPMIQIADLTGVFGISLVILLANMALADTIMFFGQKRFSAFSLIPKWSIAILMAALTLVYGYHRLNQSQQLSSKQAGEAFNVAIIQPGVEQDMKLASYADPDEQVQQALQAKMNQNLENAILEIYAKAQDGSIPKPDLYVLPESAITHSLFNIIPTLVEMVRRWSDTAQAPIFFGANRYEYPAKGMPSASNPGRMYNSAFIAQPGSGLMGYYDKVHLVPFGETFPYLRYAPFLEKFLGSLLDLGSFNYGADFPLFQAKGKTFGSYICFESCFPYLSRAYDSRQAEFLTVITNDAWYGLTSGPRRHEIQSIFRAVESRRPVVRSANTGISAIIDPWGRVTASLPLTERKMQYMVKPVPLRPEFMKSLQTVYMRPWGEWLIWLSLLYCAGVIATQFAMGRRQSEPVPEPARTKKVVAAK